MVAKHPDRLKGGTIRGSLNLPAQTLCDSLPTVYKLCMAAEINSIIWYCGQLHDVIQLALHMLRF